MNHLTPTPGHPMKGRAIRVIPTLLIDRDGRLVKSVRFGKRTYIGDPINAVRIFNTKRVDELVLLDIDASVDEREPNYSLISDIVSEAFMPVAYGGGLNSTSRIEQVINCGVEKVILSSALMDGTALIEKAASRWGSQSIVVCIPFRKNWLGVTKVSLLQGKKFLKSTLSDVVKQVVSAGAGELIVYSIDREGTWSGYDLDQLRNVCQAVNVPVIACGGAGGVQDFNLAVAESGCAAVAAGSLFVFQAKGRGVLISYPAQKQFVNFISKISESWNE